MSFDKSANAITWNKHLASGSLLHVTNIGNKRFFHAVPPQVKMVAYSEKVDNGLTLLRNILPSGRIISIDTDDGKLLRGGKSIAHVDMNNSNNNIENLQMVDLMQALHLLHEFRDEFRDGKESGDFLFC